MFIGIDLGTSGVKAIAIDDGGNVCASGLAALSVSRPQPLWSQQSPADWWSACVLAMDELAAGLRAAGLDPQGVESIGLTGQMHGATLLDARHDVLRPAILWNDGRAAAECVELERRVPTSREITGNLMMPGFTAPKLLWVQRHEPEIFKRIATVLLPKDYLRLRLCGSLATDMSDASGTLWLDVGRRDWNDELLAACGLGRQHMPPLFEGTAVTGRLSAELAGRWGLKQVPIAAGASDNAAGAIGAGIVASGQAMLSLGTSGVYFTVSDGFHANPQAAVHSFCHALPATWHLMSVMLSAASCLDFACTLTGHADVAEMLAHAAAEPMRADAPLFLPYLTGERTPHNNVNAQGVLFGMTPATRRVDVVHATLEGVGFGLLDGMRALEATGVVPDAVTVLGGGSRSAYWVQMLSDVMNRPLVRRAEGHVGPALGAARLARLAVRGEPIAQACPVPAEVQTHRPDASRHAMHAARHERFSHLYRQLVPAFELAR